jgi:hypothetical protein
VLATGGIPWEGSYHAAEAAGTARAAGPALPFHPHVPDCETAILSNRPALACSVCECEWCYKALASRTRGAGVLHSYELTTSAAPQFAAFTVQVIDQHEPRRSGSFAAGASAVPAGGARCHCTHCAL